jgi:hypothetical protein
MPKSTLSKNLSFYFILYLIIFFILPFILLKPQFLVRDVAWFIDYFIFVFPFTFAFFLLAIYKFNKNFINYRKSISWFFGVFVSIDLSIIFYSYGLVLKAFDGFKIF